MKYGWTHEIPSEAAATRLLHALGFRAHRVSRVETVRCYGCPFQPFHSRALLEMLNLEAYFDTRIHYTAHRDFKRVSVERNLDGEPIEAGDERGWAFHELTRLIRRAAARRKPKWMRSGSWPSFSTIGTTSLLIND